MSLSRRVVAFISVVLFAAAISAAVVVAATPKFPKLPTIPKLPKTKTAHVQLDIAGYVETKRLKDTTSDCYPGVTFVQTNRFEFETSHYVPTTITNISLPGTDKSVITSPFSRAVGTATVEGLLTGYRTTNFCPPSEKAPEPTPPACKKLHAAIKVALTPGGTPSEKDGLVGLGGKRLMLSIQRTGTGAEDPTCAGTGAQNVRGVDGDISVVFTGSQPGGTMIVPSGLTAIKVFNLHKKDRLRKVIVIEGPCASVGVVADKPPGNTPDAGKLLADGDCRLIGKIVLTVRATQ